MKFRDLQWNLRSARKRGDKVIEPRPNQLQIDLDGPRALRRYGLQFSILRKAGITRGWIEKLSPSVSKGHVHITITMKRNLPILERISLQAILGSDLMREAFNYSRAKRGNKYPIVFFERSSTNGPLNRNRS